MIIPKMSLKPLRPTDIFDHQTLAELAQHLAERDADPSNYTQMEPYNTANEDGTRAPVFLLHANMHVYRNLVNGLGKHHPVALQFSHHFKGVEVPARTSIPELATDAFTRLRALRPHGPYVICGYSAGAYVAIELATMLRRNGQEVPLLSLIDPPFELAARNPSATERLREKAKTVYYALGKHLGANKDARHAAQVTALYAKAVDAYALPTFQACAFDHSATCPYPGVYPNRQGLCKRFPKRPRRSFHVPKYPRRRLHRPQRKHPADQSVASHISIKQTTRGSALPGHAPSPAKLSGLRSQTSRWAKGISIPSSAKRRAISWLISDGACIA